MSAVQLPKQALTSHTNCPQFCVVTAGQEPLPAQFAASVATPLSQLGGRHCVLLAGKKQARASVPLQYPAHALPSPAQAARDPCGAPMTFVQVPTKPATSQASHWPAQARLQQTPSTH